MGLLALCLYKKCSDRFRQRDLGEAQLPLVYIRNMDQLQWSKIQEQPLLRLYSEIIARLRPVFSHPHQLPL